MIAEDENPFIHVCKVGEPVVAEVSTRAKSTGGYSPVPNPTPGIKVPSLSLTLGTEVMIDTERYFTLVGVRVITGRNGNGGIGIGTRTIGIQKSSEESREERENDRCT